MCVTTFVQYYDINLNNVGLWGQARHLVFGFMPQNTLRHIKIWYNRLFDQVHLDTNNAGRFTDVPFKSVCTI